MVTLSLRGGGQRAGLGPRAGQNKTVPTPALSHPVQMGSRKKGQVGWGPLFLTQSGDSNGGLSACIGPALALGRSRVQMVVLGARSDGQATPGLLTGGFGARQGYQCRGFFNLVLSFFFGLGPRWSALFLCEGTGNFGGLRWKTQKVGWFLRWRGVRGGVFTGSNPEPGASLRWL